jgi:ribosomal protein S18 acetylase RimI-like enzyme
VSRISARSYAGASDLPLLIDFAQRLAAACAPSLPYYHPGDFVWQLAPIGASDDARIWLDESRVVACAIFEPPITFQYEIEAETSDDLLDEVLSWVEERHAGAEGGEIPRAYAGFDRALSTWALHDDAQRAGLLEQRGYVKRGESGVRFALRLDEPIAPPELPAGATARHVEPTDITERVDLHRDAWSVWGTSTFTLQRYERIRAAPLYEPRLDVVVEFEGRLVSYCICWVDEVNRVGYFEPVGTRPRYVRRGFGRAAIREGLRRLHERGMTRAMVGTATVNPGAQALYRSAGFEIVGREHGYSKTRG